MASKTMPISNRTTPAVAPQSIREEMRPAKGMVLGITLSVVIWLSILVVWLAI